MGREEVLLEGGKLLPYDVLVVASGARLQPEETEGLTGPGWNERAFTFYTAAGADALREALERFEGGRLVVNLVDMPIKCPVAPLEFAFLADWYLRERAIRDRVELAYVTPLDGAFTKPVASDRLGSLLAAKEIELITEFNAGEVDSTNGMLRSYDERETEFDLLVTVALKAAPPSWSGQKPTVKRSGFYRPTSRRSNTKTRRASSRSATRPTFRSQRPDPSPTSRQRC